MLTICSTFLILISAVFAQCSFINSQDSTVTNNSTIPHLKDASLKVEKIISGLDSPTNIAFIKNNDFIILEKNGTVLRTINGNLLDKPINVSNGFFQGMLGIAIAHSNKTSSNTATTANTATSISSNGQPQRVFLYYTEDKGNGTSPIGATEILTRRDLYVF
jgi:glucose/arabinose dehydrogenase